MTIGPPLTTRTLTLELPEDLVESLGSVDAAARRAKEALVFELLREGRIGQSRIAELLGISRWDVLDLMGKYGVTQGPRSEADLATDVQQAEKSAARR